MPVFLRRHSAFSLSLLIAAIAAIFLVWHEPTAGRVLLVWDIAVLAYLGIVWYRMLTSSLTRLKKRAADLDLSDTVILVLSVAAAVASIAGIGFELVGSRSASLDGKLFGAGFAMATVLLSWTFLHTLFTQHYAHRYYSDDGDRGGLRFPEDNPQPGYWDFLYFSFTVGVAAQTADVSVTSTFMRRMVFVHAVLSFLFNTTILALAINIGASLV